MHWGTAIIFFALGTFLGPWLLAMVSGKGKSAKSY